MKKQYTLVATFVFTLMTLSTTAHAAIVNPILGLDIGGTLYDVTFHDGAGDSFNALWDADNDGVFGGGGSVFSVAPTFWGDQSGAQAAAAAIIQALGTGDVTTGLFDSFLVPVGSFAPNALTLTSGQDGIRTIIDLFEDPGNDVLGTLGITDSGALSFRPYASFAITTSVPVPAAIWLFASGLLGLIGVARKKVRV